MTRRTTLKLDQAATAARIEKDIKAFARFGGEKVPGRAPGETLTAVTRPALSEADLAARAHLTALMEDLDLAVRADPVGNIIGTWVAGGAPSPDAPPAPATGLAPVAVGSHLDSVPMGGRFDGVAGIVVGLEAIRRLRVSGFEPARPIELIDFTNEEGARFSPGLFGSQAMLGKFSPGALWEMRDAGGRSMYDALVAAGHEPDRLESGRACRAWKPRRRGDLAAYFEVHIEQAGVLESRGLPLGVVTGIAGPAYLEVTVEGRAAHAGATPMGLRHDAMAAAAEVILEVEKVARADANRVVATVGRLSVEPGAGNVIPGRVRFTVDVRSIDEKARVDAAFAVKAAAMKVAQARQVSIDVEQTSEFAPVLLPEKMIGLLERAATEAGESVRRAEATFCRLPSGAAHDAMMIAQIAPVGMLFVRSLGGVSHSPEELTSYEDLALAAMVLERALRETAGH